MDKTKIRLNLPCKICKEIIYIEDGTIIEGRALHFKCYNTECFNAGKLDLLKLKDGNKPLNNHKLLYDEGYKAGSSLKNIVKLMEQAKEEGKKDKEKEILDSFEKMIDECETIGEEGNAYLIDKADLKQRLSQLQSKEEMK